MFAWIKELVSRTRSWISPRRIDVDFQQEFDSHLEFLTSENLRRGMSPEKAQREARIRLGGFTQLKETNRELRGWPMLETFLQDVRFTVRVLRKSPAFAIVAILTLALGIGANTAVFSLVRGVLLRPLVNRDENRLIFIHQSFNGKDAPFSMPEIHDLSAGVKTVTEFGDFSTINFTMLGLGEPRVVLAGVVGGSYFDVMGLRPVLGRLLDMRDDGPQAEGAVVLTYRFWNTVLHGDTSVIGKTVRLNGSGLHSATIVGVLEPSVPYPTETEIIANVVTSSHHLSATMVTRRAHRMTELFGRVAPGITLDQARAELSGVYANLVKANPESYPKNSQVEIGATLLRDQVSASARTILLVLLAASGLVFIIACSNVANLILARSVRRESELAIRSALGATSGALRRTLLAESLLLCGAGATLGVISARPMVAVLARYAARYSVRALDLTVDSSMLWVGAGLAVVAAVLLAFVPRLPSANGSKGVTKSRDTVRVAGGTRRRLRVFAVVQIAASFVLLAGASMLLKTLISQQTVQTGLDLHRILAMNVPVTSFGATPEKISAFYRETLRRVQNLPGVDNVAIGTVVPWRDTGIFDRGSPFTADGYVRAAGEEDPRAELRPISPGFFSTMGVPILAGRDFNDSDRSSSEPVVMISQSVAKRMFPNQDAIDHHLTLTDDMMNSMLRSGGAPARIIGVAADLDDSHMIPGPAMAIYIPFDDMMLGGRLFIRTSVNPYSLVTPIIRVVRELSADQPVYRAATLADVRAEILTPDRLNTFVFGGFAVVALIIAVVGVAGVLAFSVSARTREFGIRLAVGSQPRQLLTGVIGEGAVMAGIGIAVGAASGFALARLAGSYFQIVQMPGVVVIIASAIVLLAAAVIASALPAARAARVDVVQALRAD